MPQPRKHRNNAYERELRHNACESHCESREHLSNLESGFSFIRTYHAKKHWNPNNSTES